MPNAFLKVNIIVRIQGDFRGDLRRFTCSISTIKTLFYLEMIKTITLLAQRPEKGDQQFELPQESSETSAEFSDLIRHVWY